MNRTNLIDEPNAILTPKQEKKLCRRMAIQLETDRRRQLPYEERRKYRTPNDSLESFNWLARDAFQMMAQYRLFLVANVDPYECIPSIRENYFKQYFVYKKEYRRLVKFVYEYSHRWPEQSVIPLP